MKSLSRALVLALFAASLTLSFVSCSFEPDKTDEPPALYTVQPLDYLSGLKGTWLDEIYNDGFTLTDTVITYFYRDSVNFSGNIVNIRTTTSNPSYTYVTLKITVAESYYTDLNGKYYVVCFSDIGESTFKESSANKVDGTTNYGFEKQLDAESEYTVTNSYFGYFGTYSKQ